MKIKAALTEDGWATCTLGDVVNALEQIEDEELLEYSLLAILNKLHNA